MRGGGLPSGDCSAPRLRRPYRRGAQGSGGKCMKFPGSIPAICPNPGVPFQERLTGGWKAVIPVCTAATWHMIRHRKPRPGGRLGLRPGCRSRY